MSVATVLTTLLALAAASTSSTPTASSTSNQGGGPAAKGSSTVALTIPSSVPASAHGPVSHSWLGFGIEGSSFPNYAGTPSKPNMFSQNLIDTISNRTGAPAIIRLGGTSLDHAKLKLDQTEPVRQGGGRPANVIIGPSWFELLKNFPNSLYTLQVPFATGNLSFVVDYTERSLPHLGSRLSSIEIGNEPAAYIGVDRPQNWTLKEYVAQWKVYADALAQKLPLPQGRIFEGLSLASSTHLNHPDWTVSNAYKYGYFNNTRLKTISQHYYENKDDVNLAGTLLNHSYTEEQTDRFRAPINFMHSKTPEVAFILGEAASSLGGGTSNKTQNLEFATGLGAAVWTLDWMLYSMSIGVKAVSMQQGNNFTFSAWIPKPALGIGPTVFSPYMAHVAAADFIGKNNCSGLFVTALNTSNPHTSAYAGYRGGKVSQVVATNLQSWAGRGTRPSITVSIPIHTGADTVTVRRLTGANTNARENVTWAGETWTFASKGLPVRLSHATEAVHVSGGIARVPVAASEAVMVDIVKTASQGC